MTETVNLLDARRDGFGLVQEQIDATILGGKLLLHVFGALAEWFERKSIGRGTYTGFKAVRAQQNWRTPKEIVAKTI